MGTFFIAFACVQMHTERHNYALKPHWSLVGYLMVLKGHWAPLLTKIFLVMFHI